MGDLLGYARVSTLEQNSRLQTDALKSAGCYRVFTDRASGALDERREFAKLFDQARPGDTVVVWRLDRLGRSLRHLIDTVNSLAERKVGFRSLTENIDTTTSGGKLVFHIFGALAEFERELIRERTTAGLAAARARGRHGGRPTVMSPDKVATARQMYDSKEFTVEAIARVLGVSRASIYRHLAGPASSPHPDGGTGSAEVAAPPLPQKPRTRAARRA
jgi:DNA invertase Pin-like site-specific DNA recombinase